MSAASDRDFIARAIRYGLIGLALTVLFLVLLRVLRAALTPLALAFVIAYLLDPLIDRFEARRVPRKIAVAFLVLLVGGGVTALTFLLLPRLIGEVSALASALPSYLDELSRSALPQLEARLGIELPATVGEALTRLRSGEIPLPLEAVAGVLRNALSTLTGTASVLVGLAVTPILAYYLLVEFDTMIAALGTAVPPRHRVYVFEKVRMVDRLISGFLRGQLLIAASLALLYAVGFTAIGIDAAVGVGLVAGALSLIPYVGSAFALAAGAGLAALKFGLDGHLLAVGILYVAVQSFEGFVLTPRIQGRSVGLHPAAILIALLIGGDLFGFLGLIVAVPAAAVLRVFAAELMTAYRSSTLFTAEEAPPG